MIFEVTASGALPFLPYVQPCSICPKPQQINVYSLYFVEFAIILIIVAMSATSTAPSTFTSAAGLFTLLAIMSITEAMSATSTTMSPFTSPLG